MPDRLHTALIAILFVFASGSANGTQSPGTVKYDYLLEDITYEVPKSMSLKSKSERKKVQKYFESELKKYGEKGWELVSLKWDSMTEVAVVFKRKK